MKRDRWLVIDFNCEKGAISRFLERLREDEIEVLVASRGEGNPYRPGDREHFAGPGLYCETVIKSGKKLLVPDALADENWKKNPDVKLNMISCLGFPIFLPDGFPTPFSLETNHHNGSIVL